MTSLVLRGVDMTDRVAAGLAPLIDDGALVLLSGHLGAGKTALVQSLARAMGVTEPVRSPTFTVAHRYELPDGAGFVAHLDLYRTQGGVGVSAWADLEPYFEARCICVEWPAPLPAHAGLDRPTWRLELEWPGDAPVDVRTLRISAPDPSAGRHCADVVARLLR